MPRAHDLKKYRDKRTASGTPEPFGAAPEAGSTGAGLVGEPRPFCVQKHAARRLHYDFRLELGGVLVSWAVPRGPSLDAAEKRFAVEVEDHPVEYADFEGVIPAGNYGAGAVIVWDRGVWIPTTDPVAGLRDGKLDFELRGYKLRGLWHMVRTKRAAAKDPPEWLLMKKADGWARPPDFALDEGSIYSGLTLEEIEAGPRRAAEALHSLEKAGARRRAVPVDDVKLMLAETRDEPFTDDGWVFELKHDGFRLLAAREGGRPRLVYRRGGDSTHVFPEIARALLGLPYEDLVLDGEVVVLDERGRPSFQGLQKRVQLTRKTDLDRAALERPATLFVFDLLAFQGYDLRPLPLLARKQALRLLMPSAGPLRYADHVAREGEAFYEEVAKLGLEGIVAKRADAPYVGGRSPQWLKLKADKTGDFVVVGFTRPQGARSGFGALHLGAYDGERLLYVGRAGSGFGDKQLADTRKRLDALERKACACEGPLPKGREHVWVEPELVCEVRYKEWTEEGLLRQPVFLRFREDKDPRECLYQDVAGGPSGPPQERPRAAPEPAAREVHFSNLDKVFWPAEKYTKGDLIAFYRTVSPWLLPYLKDRPLVLTRYPDGIGGKSFYQKDAPDFVPAWIRRFGIFSKDTDRDIEYFVADDVETLVYLANLGTIPLHVWSSRTKTLDFPDWCILDLDPKGAPFAHVVELALLIKRLCDEVGLPALPKTSGASGLHVLIPLGAQVTYEQSRSIAQLLAYEVTRERGDIATIERAIRGRQGKVYVDYLQNVHGQLLVSPFSVRPLPGAPVSTPLVWSEVGPALDPKDFTIRTVPPRLAAQERDPLLPVLELKPDLLEALGKLQERLTRGTVGKG
jgi:bifunctional non-homologous end joining protein LigD